MDAPPKVSEIDFSDVWIDEFHFRKKLGDGGFASVWLADQCDANRKRLRPVAIKVFVDDPKDSRSFRNTVESFQRDSRFLAGLATGNPIVEYHLNRICDLFVDKRRIPRTLRSTGEPDLGEGWALTAFLVVMEYADGGCLGQTYRTEVVLQGDNSWVDHFLDVCTALRAAHGRNIVHRDIKPHNIMWFRSLNRVKMGDFGTAKDFSEGGFAEAYLLGSLPYMSPEAFRGHAPPERDIFALGCTFFELLTGEKPFAGVDPTSLGSNPAPNFEQYVKVRHESPRPDAFVIVPRIVSMDLSRLLKRMMSAAIDERPKLSEIMVVLQKEKPHRVFLWKNCAPCAWTA